MCFRLCFRNEQLVINRRRLSFLCKDILYFFIYICACAIVVFASDRLLEQLNCKLSWERNTLGKYIDQAGLLNIFKKSQGPEKLKGIFGPKKLNVSGFLWCSIFYFVVGNSNIAGIFLVIFNESKDLAKFQGFWIFLF